jgi:hypothetical protein
VLRYVPDADVVARLQQLWSSSSSRSNSHGGDINVARWEDLVAAVDAKVGGRSGKGRCARHEILGVPWGVTVCGVARCWLQLGRGV